MSIHGLIHGKMGALCPAAIDDRRTLYGWSNDSDIAHLIRRSDDASETFEHFRREWKEHFLTDT